MEIVHNHDNDHLDWLFHWNIFPLRESTSIMSGNGEGFTLEELGTLSKLTRRPRGGGQEAIETLSMTTPSTRRSRQFFQLISVAR